MDESNKNLLAQELARTISRFWRFNKQSNNCEGIKHSEFMLLGTLIQFSDSDAKGIKLSDLSNHMQITPAAVTHMINSLEEGGYVERLPDSSDRRVVLVKPTVKAKKVIESMNTKRLENLSGLVGFMGEEDSKELIRLLLLAFTYVKERRNNDAR